jgi:hypothetical protein
MRCHWHRMHENFLLGSPFKFIYFFSGGVDQFGNIYVFVRYSLLRLPGSLKSFVDRACGAIFCMWCQWHRIHLACGVNYPACIVHAVSLTPHAPCMRCHWHCMHFKFFCIASPFCISFSLFKVVRKFYWACGVNDTAFIFTNSKIFANSNLYSKRV